MLCKYCTNIDIDKLNTKNGVRHHASLKELERCASTSCDLCALISRLALQYDIRWFSGDEPDDISSLSNSQIICRARTSRHKGFNAVEFWQPKSRVEEDDPLSKLIDGRRLAESSDSSSVFELASSWLRECREEHPMCSSGPHALPTRVIDVGWSDTEVSLVVSSGRNGEWVALSHCWGGSREGLTTLANFVHRQQGLYTSELPSLFRDAIHITRKLGFRYLWIDSLCIIQDSRPDWESECLKMNEYYRNCFLNISASFASNSREGIFSSANSRQWATLLMTVQGHSTTHDINGKIHFRRQSRDIKESPLNQRAWVLQESLLSPRVLWYDADQLRWDCITVCIDEDIPGPFDKKNYRHKLGRLILRNNVKNEDSAFDILWCWYCYLNNFVHRRIQFPSDRLPAIAGLAAEVSRRSGFHYKHGLWEEDILGGLRWNAHGTKIQLDVSTGIPSWSWASVEGISPKGQRLFCYHHKRISDSDAHFMGFSNTGDFHSDIPGQAMPRSISLNGRWQLLKTSNRLPYFETNIDRRSDHPISIPPKSDQIRISLDSWPDLEKSFFERLRPDIIYFQLGKWDGSLMPLFKEQCEMIYALVLEPLNTGEDQYRRIGIAEIPKGYTEAQEWPTRTVNIF